MLACFLKCQRTVVQKIGFGYFLAEALWGTAHLQTPPPDTIQVCLPSCVPPSTPLCGGERQLSAGSQGQIVVNGSLVSGHIVESLWTCSLSMKYIQRIFILMIFKLIQTYRAYFCMFALNCGLLSKLYF